MKDYKPVLRVLAKPERIVAYYLIALSLISVSLIVCLVQTYALLCLFPFVIFFRMKWKKYYLLTANSAVKEVCINENDLIVVEYQSDKTCPVELVDQLHLNKYLILYFIEESSYASDVQYKESGVWFFVKEKIKWHLREIFLFLNYKKIVFVVSEDSLGTNAYREFLRRLYSL